MDVLIELGHDHNEDICFLINNMGCCLCEDGKQELAYDYFRMSEKMLVDINGTFNENTICVKNNIERLLNQNIEFSIPDLPTFKFFYRDPLNATINKKGGAKPKPKPK